MARVNPFQFLQQTRAEIGKVAWPTRREVFLTSTMVFVMAAVAAMFFFAVDWFIRTGLQALLSFVG